MLKDTQAWSSFAVKDIAAAKDFYANTLGLEVSENQMGMLDIKLGSGAKVMAYPKPDLQPSNNTILMFPVDDIDKVVDDLTSKGVRFERYEGFEQDAKGIARGAPGKGPDNAWVKDPSGNILSILKDNS